MKKQQGMTFIGLVLMVAGVVFIAVIGMKLVPSYIEYASIKKAIKKVSNESGFNEMSTKDIKSSFEKSATIDDIKSITPNDLVISRTDSGTSIEVEYQVVVPLVANVSALIDFKASNHK